MNVARDVHVLIDHGDSLLAAGAVAVLSDQPGIRVLASHADVTGEESSSREVQVVVTDLERALSGAQRLRARARLLIISGVDGEHDLQRAIKMGGCVLQSCTPQELVHGIRRVGQGLPYMCPATAAVLARGMFAEPLTSRQIQVLRLVVEGRGNKTIARELGLTEGTVKTHVRGILERLRASSRMQAAIIAQARGLIAGSPRHPVEA